jgi:hypothetical protein
MQPVVSMQAVPVVTMGLAASATQSLGVGSGIGLGAFGASALGLSGLGATGLNLNLGSALAAGLSESDMRLLRTALARAVSQAADARSETRTNGSAESVNGASTPDSATQIRELNRKLDAAIEDLRKHLNALTETVDKSSEAIGSLKESSATKKELDERIKKLIATLKKNEELKKLLEKDGE